MDRIQHVSVLAATGDPLVPTAVGTPARSAASPAPDPSLIGPEAPAASVASASSALTPATVTVPAVPAWVAVANLALTVLCSVAIVATLALTVGPRFLAYETFIVRSGSMEPSILTGSLVLVQPVHPRDIKVGDVITYRRPEEPDRTITHRVTNVRVPETPLKAGPVFRTKGDANAAVDPWEVQLHGVVWRVSLSVPLAGYLFAFTQQPAGRALFLIVPGVGLGALWLHRSWVRLRRPSVGVG